MATTYHMDFKRTDGTEVSVEYSITDYDPGVSSGPAESCYPPEGGEVEIVKVFNEANPDITITDEEDASWSKSIFEGHDFSADDYDDYDDWRDDR